MRKISNFKFLISNGQYWKLVLLEIGIIGNSIDWGTIYG